LSTRCLRIRHRRVHKGAITLHGGDIAAAHSELDARGVTFHGDILDSGVCYGALYQDQDGNAPILDHRDAPPAAEP
jgi:hypothetical protein